MDAISLVARDIAALPVNGGPDGAERLIGHPRRAAQFGHGKIPDTGDVLFNHVSFEIGHLGSSGL